METLSVAGSMNKLSCQKQIYNLGVTMLWAPVTALLIWSKEKKKQKKNPSLLMWNVHESVLSKTTEKHADLLSSRGHAAPEGERENGSHFHSSEVVCRPRKHLNSFPLLIFPFAERKLLNLASSLGSRWVCANWLWKWCKFGIWMFKGCCFFRSYQTHKTPPQKTDEIHV